MGKSKPFHCGVSGKWRMPRCRVVLPQLIEKCTATSSLRVARKIHALILTSALTYVESPVFIFNLILSMYARCGSMVDSHVVFDKMPLRNVVSYSSLMSAYSRIPRQAHMAFLLFHQMENDGLAPSGFTLTSLLQASAYMGDVVLGSSVHGKCVKIGFLNNIRVQTSLIGMYSNCWNSSLAMNVFQEVMNPDDLAWNSMISGQVKNGKLFECLILFRQMVRDGIHPTEFTYSLILNACAKLEDLEIGMAIHAQVLVSAMCVDLPLHNSLLDMYCSCGDPNTALDVFVRIENPDLVSWNSIIRGFSESGDGEKAMNLFIHLTRQSILKPDEYTLAAVVSGTGEFPGSKYGQPLHAHSMKTGLACSLYVAIMLISMYFSNNDAKSSRKIFLCLEHKDDILWTDMIAWHVRIGESEEAMIFFYNMIKEGYTVDTFTLSSALSACADLAALRQGEMIHCFAVKTGNENEVFVRSSMIDMYAKTGEIEDATHVFSCLPKCDIMCWNSLLTGYGHHGKAKEAFQIYYQMLKHGVRPDHVTFLSLLAACNHCGLVEESSFFWNSMKEHGLKPGPNHYSCIISCMSRAGQWGEAEEVILQSPFVDDYMESWRTMLSSCIKDGNLEVGIQAAQHILNAKTEDNATATLLLTKLYAAAGRWDDASEMRSKMRKTMPEKYTGLSSIHIQSMQ